MTGEEIQVENGEFVRLHNAILEKMALARLSGAEFRALMFLFRKTYGWNKKEDRISLAQWAEGTNGKRPHVLRTLNELIRKRVIYRIDDEQQVPVYGFNKYTENWLEVFDVDSERGQRFERHPEVLPIQVTVTNTGKASVTSAGNTSVTNAGNASVTNTGTHKRQKETIKDIAPLSEALPLFADELDAAPPALAKPVKAKPVKTKPDTPKPPTAHWVMMTAIASACKQDLSIDTIAARCGKSARGLLRANYTPEIVEYFRDVTWPNDEYNKAKPHSPSINELETKIYQAKLAYEAKNGNGLHAGTAPPAPSVPVKERPRDTKYAEMLKANGLPAEV